MNNIMQKMIDWIEDHLVEEFSLKELGSHMGYSPYYCSFKFHQMTGITIKRYMSLRKIYLASIDLKESDQKMIDVAHKYGFSSQEAFTRAFKITFGTSPAVYRRDPQPLQTVVKLNVTATKGGFSMDVSEKMKIVALQNKAQQQFDRDILNVLNGQLMYEEFSHEKLMEHSDYVPLNEAMCSNKTTKPIFSTEFIKVRAKGHRVSTEEYETKVINALKPLFKNQYTCIILWFGNDMFCQINMLTLLAYLEEQGFKGKVYFHMVKEIERTFEVEEIEIELGDFQDVYDQVMIHKQWPTKNVMPVMYQGIKLYLEYQMQENELTSYIRNHLDMPQNELIRQLFKLFPQYGIGDLQYIEMIEKVKNNR
ncbi:helix-turn-helix transcriptional regulator [Alkalicoccobacillus porphyridii]|uniref:Helix-turn-helix transcriptional regulator n=1 Tax=Alkalicoccobacillus porphyridii TaxID=2597270 RepID=A0A553ZVE9_9BACI|nr:AraC family transcriptional regulator [Alkalicoccobacillus porphyridii]TSB45315.1 helix-turn-helix transcriptional regulator [Alkalicoccobacillus porphyridii]